MLEKGRVVALKGEVAVVQFMRTSACKNCGACLKAGDSEMAVEVTNTLNAKVNDEVSVELPERNFFQAAFLMYGIPLAALLIALFVTSALTTSELTVIGVSVASAVLAFVLLRLLEPVFKRSPRYAVKMIQLYKAE